MCSMTVWARRLATLCILLLPLPSLGQSCATTPAAWVYSYAISGCCESYSGVVATASQGCAALNGLHFTVKSTNPQSTDTTKATEVPGSQEIPTSPTSS